MPLTPAFPDFWPPEPDPSRRGPDARAKAGPAATPAMRRAEETNRVARESIDAATEKRLAQVAKLKAARLERDAAGVEAAPVPEPKAAAKPAAKRKKK